MSDLQSALDLLLGQSEVSMAVLFWYTLIFEVPRYGAAFVALALAEVFQRKDLSDGPPSRVDGSRVTVMVVGHNEADSIERCVRSLREQSVKGIEIVVVSDGSTDAMTSVVARLVKQGVVDRAMRTDLRGGKSAGMNLALFAATREFIVNVDCDTTFDRFALERICAPFEDPQIGAASGDILVGNANQSLTARLQSIEYLFTISVGKRINDALGIVSCVSGAFGAFRAKALRQVGGVDVGGGEDLDLTLRLRAAGWRIAFVGDAISYTHVPASLYGLVQQRMRWDRDAIRLRYRKHRGSIAPFSDRFVVLEAIHQFEYLFFSVLGTLIFPFYLLWLFALYGSFAVVVLIAAQIALSCLDAVMLLLAALITKRPVFFQDLPYMPGFSIMNAYVMRVVRLSAYWQEWLRFGSVNDNYVPHKVRILRRW